MPKTVEFFFDYGSTFSYLAWCAMPGVAQRTGATVVHRPMLLGGLFKIVGNHSPVDVPAKGAYMKLEMQRNAQRAGVPFRMNSRFPVNSLHLMRGAIAAQEDGKLVPYSDAVFTALWRDDKDLTDLNVLGQVLGAAGVDARALLERTGQQAIKDKLKANTDEAAQRGAFGAPTFFVGGEMFWGFDRLEQVAEALRG